MDKPNLPELTEPGEHWVIGTGPLGVYPWVSLCVRKSTLWGLIRWTETVESSWTSDEHASVSEEVEWLAARILARREARRRRDAEFEKIKGEY